MNKASGRGDAKTGLSAVQFIERLKAGRKDRNAPEPNGDASSLGVTMGQVFALAKEFSEMIPLEIERLLESSIDQVRLGAVSIMDFQARRKNTSENRRRELFELYLRRHDRIDGWGMVDRAAPYVIGGYLFDKPRDPLYSLARSDSVWERRTAIVSTYFFIRQGEVAGTFGIAEVLVDDPHDLIQRAVGGWVREAGKIAPQRLLNFLDKHAATMPRTALRYAIELLEKKPREHYLNLKRLSTGAGERI
jgi:3-methyladenine DNA glycosylase AlkD